MPDKIDRQAEPIARANNTLGIGDLSTQPSSVQDSADAKLPIEFGRYRLLKQLGEGGMGVVYLAHDIELDRKVALKLPHFSGAKSKDLAERFRREARLAATLDHPNICRIYDIGEHKGRLFLTMAFVEGRSLHEIIRAKGPIEPRAAVTLLKRIATAVQFAHAQGIIHRDLKPANIMIKKDRDFVIMDFGLARRVDQEEAQLTATGAVLGTPAYMAPEQLRGVKDAIGPPSDVYSLGIILFELLTGQRPFQGTLPQIYAQVLSTASVTPSVMRSGIDPALDAICQQATHADAKQRFKTADEFATVLSNYLVPLASVPSLDKQVAASRPKLEFKPQPRSRLPPRRRNRSSLISVGGAAVFLALLGFIVIKIINRDGTTTELRVSSDAVSVEVLKEDQSTIAKLDVTAIAKTEGTDHQKVAPDASVPLTARAPASVVPSTGSAVFEISPMDDKAVYSIDGNEYRRTDLEQPMHLPAGEHNLVVTLGGRTLLSEPFTIAANKRKIVEVISTDRRAARRVLELGGTLSVLIGGVVHEIKTGSAVPELDFQIKGIGLWGNETVRDDDLKNFKDLTELEAIDLYNTAITDAGLQFLHDKKKLVTLHLGNTRISEAGLDSLLSSLPPLRALGIASTDVSDPIMSRLIHSPLNMGLELRGTKVGDIGLRHLKGKQMWHCTLESAPVTDEGLKNLEGCGFDILVLSNTRITDMGLEHMKKFTKLGALHLKNTKTTEAGVKSLLTAFPECKIER